MKKIIFIAVCCVFLTSCGNGPATTGSGVIKDKNETVVGYLSDSLMMPTRVQSDSIYMSGVIMQDLKGDFVWVNLASGKLLRDDILYFSDANCGGTAYVPDTMINALYKTYPFMTDSTKTVVDASAAEKVYIINSAAAGTETIKSFLVLDTAPSDVNRFNAADSSTYKYLCVSVTNLLAQAVAAGKATALGQCVNSGQVTCSDTTDITGWTPTGFFSFCSNPLTPCSGTFTPYADQTALPLTVETYTKDWGVLTEVSAQDITDKKVIVDYSQVAPLKVSISD